MLRRLLIRDFAIIDHLTVHFEPGLTVMSGETGAGKSIIVDALGLALGGRAQGDMVRSGRNETVVEAFFDDTEHPLLDGLGIPVDDGIILRRSFSLPGKSRAFVNDTMVNVQTLLDVGKTLVDIHGQHEHQSLLFQENQRALIDAYGKLVDERTEFGRCYHEVQSMKKELSLLTAGVREKEQRIDLLRFLIQEIDAASLKAGEKEALEEERAILVNLAKLVELTGGAHALLSAENGSVMEKLSSALAMLREVGRIDTGAAEILSLLESAKPLVEDASSSLRSYRDRYDIDPRRRDDLEERLDLIKKLERKYGEGTEGVLRQRDEAEKELQGLVLSDERVKELEETLVREEKRLYEKAARLTEKRMAAAREIEGSAKAVLKELAMEKARFTIAMNETGLSPTGKDSVEFLFSANSGEPPKSLSRTASGGELSRVMLALKETLAGVDRIPVLIFDEVDAGIGGGTAGRVGIRLKNLSGRHQVLCVTHLPQIAALADHHMVIEKVQEKDGVAVSVREAAAKEREEEIARMLSGKVTEISRTHARELLGRKQ